MIRYAREQGITLIVLGHSDRSRWQEFVNGSIINDITRELRSVDILIVASGEAAKRWRRCFEKTRTGHMLVTGSRSKCEDAGD